MTEQNRLFIRVMDFTKLMYLKLDKQFRRGYRGWDCSGYEHTIKERLKDNIEREDWVDVANLAMMLHGFSEAATPQKGK